ncbi:hypothetical protein CLV56_4033 [Mumia flava]|uniref:Bleomycin resistance protein n=1 Tax=Mumia flava TaxID=1348852 RepID=A0A2M9AR33_9ACTN|nr:hypothetical protein [Mumia flava]PJJ48157.1 hypothetical protein CLV56_4033 [Mumia flava]
MSSSARDRATTRPILPSSDLERTSVFYADLGFTELGRWAGEYLIVRDDCDIELHFWYDLRVSRWDNDVACWIGFESPDAVRRLHARWSRTDLSQPAQLRAPETSDALVEFQLIDLDGNLLRVGAPRATR